MLKDRLLEAIKEAQAEFDTGGPRKVYEPVINTLEQLAAFVDQHVPTKQAEESPAIPYQKAIVKEKKPAAAGLTK